MELFVEHRDGQHPNLVVHLTDAVDLRHTIGDVVPLVGHRDIARQRDDAAFADGDVDIVEHGEAGVPIHLLRDVVVDLPVLPLGLARECGTGRERQDKNRRCQFLCHGPSLLTRLYEWQV
jgi:hypothetical protein